MGEPTRPDSNLPTDWQLNDTVTRLREWGTDRIYELPSQAGAWTIGASDDCDVQLRDLLRHTSRQHAWLTRDDATCTMTDADSKNGLWLDNARRQMFELAPGMEIGIGSLRLVAESPRTIAMRAFLARLIGWSAGRRRDVDRALRAVRMAAAHRAPLQLCGEGNVVAVAWSLHRRLFGEAAPFVVSVPDRSTQPQTRAHPGNLRELPRALEAAAGGTLCVWTHRPPAGFATAQLELACGTSARLFACSQLTEDSPGPNSPWVSVMLTPLSQRIDELDRLIDDYAADAVAALSAHSSSFTTDDRLWVRRRRPKTLDAIETMVMRVVAVRERQTLSDAAAQLGISHVALSRWFGRRARRSPG